MWAAGRLVDKIPICWQIVMLSCVCVICRCNLIRFKSESHQYSRKGVTCSDSLKEKRRWWLVLYEVVILSIVERSSSPILKSFHVLKLASVPYFMFSY
jgi:hypothetical protein